MKITKSKEVVTEEIEINAGIYYFEDSDLTSHKIIMEEEEDGYTYYVLETLYNFGNIFGIRVRQDSMDSKNIPYVFKQFILGISGKKIEKEDYYKEREEIKQKL